MRRPRIGITLGDPRGIGPEVVRKALQVAELGALADYVTFGAPGERTAGAAEHVAAGEWRSREGAAAAGRLAGLAIQRAVRAAIHGEVDALVTAPIEKSAFRAGGWDFPGHTEMLRAAADVPEVAMMMVSERTLLGGALRVVLATTHLPLREVTRALSPQLLIGQAELAEHALRRWWKIERPRIALCGVNPHASDGGLFGDEEERIVSPALAVLLNRGLDARGPLPADTVFTRAIRGEFDVVIAPYHDVGMAAFKTASFGTGVNVTLGLPFPRTSPDHGTALDIAGQEIADPSSMVEAIRLATRLAPL